MTRVGWFFAAAALVAATSASATTYPGPGTYAASVYVSQTTGSDCLDYYGLSFTGVLNYGGLDDDRAGLRLPLGDERDVSIQTLTTKSGIGTLTPSGTFIWKVGGFQPFTGTWSASAHGRRHRLFRSRHHREIRRLYGISQRCPDARWEPSELGQLRRRRADEIGEHHGADRMVLCGCGNAHGGVRVGHDLSGARHLWGVCLCRIGQRPVPGLAGRALCRRPELRRARRQSCRAAHPHRLRGRAFDSNADRESRDWHLDAERHLHLEDLRRAHRGPHGYGNVVGNAQGARHRLFRGGHHREIQQQRLYGRP